MAASELTFDSLRKTIRKGDLARVYLLHGEESYYIDELVKDFEKVLPEADREFNQYVLYAPSVTAGEIRDLCERLPMMSDIQMVIVKEAQSVRADQINKLYKYVQNPSPSTVLVIVFRGETAKGKELIAAAKKKGVVYESKKIRDYQLVTHIQAIVKSKKLNIDPKALEMLKDFIGNDLSTMHNEIDKLALILGENATITPEAVERNIGISKDYNTFELIDALSVKDAAKTFRIADYFAANPKANPTVMITAALYNFYSDLLVAFYAKDKSEQGLMRELNMKYAVQVRKFTAALRAYNAFQVIECIWALRQFDTRSKGRGSRQNEYQLFRELMFHLLSAPGNLGLPQ